jgi:hypothetical protein
MGSGGSLSSPVTRCARVIVCFKLLARRDRHFIVISIEAFDVSSPNGSELPPYIVVVVTIRTEWLTERVYAMLRGMLLTTSLTLDECSIRSRAALTVADKPPW